MGKNGVISKYPPPPAITLQSLRRRHRRQFLKIQASLTAHWHDKGADWRGLAPDTHRLTCRVCCRRFHVVEPTSLYNARSSSRGGCRALQLYSALHLYISTALYTLHPLHPPSACARRRKRKQRVAGKEWGKRETVRRKGAPPKGQRCVF